MAHSTWVSGTSLSGLYPLRFTHLTRPHSLSVAIARRTVLVLMLSLLATQFWDGSSRPFAPSSCTRNVPTRSSRDPGLQKLLRCMSHRLRSAGFNSVRGPVPNTLPGRKIPMTVFMFCAPAERPDAHAPPLVRGCVKTCDVVKKPGSKIRACLTNMRFSGFFTALGFITTCIAYFGGRPSGRLSAFLGVDRRSFGVCEVAERFHLIHENIRLTTLGCAICRPFRVQAAFFGLARCARRPIASAMAVGDTSPASDPSRANRTPPAATASR